MNSIPAKRSSPTHVWIPIGAGLFLVALAVSAVAVPQLRLLHLLQAFIYVAIVILVRRNNVFALGAGFTIAFAWNCLEFFGPHLIQAGAILLWTFLHTGQVRDAMLGWVRSVTKATDVTLSVCTGAFLLAATGLLSGSSATTFHEAYERFEARYPDIHLKRGARFVEDGNLASAGGLSSGIDLAIRVIERYFGREAAERTAYALEYQGKGWQNSNSNGIYAH